MTAKSIQGQWDLQRYDYVEDEIPYGDNDDIQGDAEVAAWLMGSTVELVAAAAPRTGLILRIQADGFSEEVTGFEGLLYDVLGVQVNDYKPMRGTLVELDGDVCFLMPDGVPNWAKPDGEKLPGLRYDDGDTKVTDSLRLVDDQLVRQISVVTDEIYLERIVLVYHRVG